MDTLKQCTICSSFTMELRILILLITAVRLMTEGVLNKSYNCWLPWIPVYFILLNLLLVTLVRRLVMVLWVVQENLLIILISNLLQLARKKNWLQKSFGRHRYIKGPKKNWRPDLKLTLTLQMLQTLKNHFNVIVKCASLLYYL